MANRLSTLLTYFVAVIAWSLFLYICGVQASL